jgi:hypothetical protein
LGLWPFQHFYYLQNGKTTVVVVVDDEPVELAPGGSGHQQSKGSTCKPFQQKVAMHCPLTFLIDIACTKLMI